MTLTEASRILHIKQETVFNAAKEIAKTCKSVSDMYVNGKLWVSSEFNLDEMKLIYKQLGRNELEIILLEENWVEKPRKDIYTITGTNKFIEDYKKNKYIKCCNTCKYLIGKAVNTKMPRPFCTVYNMLLESMPAKVYEDYCTSHSYTKLEKPRMWFKENAPSNLNMFGEINTINGIDKEKIKPRSSGEPVRLLGQIGFD